MSGYRRTFGIAAMACAATFNVAMATRILDASTSVNSKTTAAIPPVAYVRYSNVCRSSSCGSNPSSVFANELPTCIALSGSMPAFAAQSVATPPSVTLIKMSVPQIITPAQKRISVIQTTLKTTPPIIPVTMMMFTPREASAAYSCSRSSFLIAARSLSR